MRDLLPVNAVLGFWAVAVLLIIVPGPDWAFVIGAGLRSHVVPAATGIALGYVAMTVAVACGIGPLLADQPMMMALTVAGALYLMYLGVNSVARPAMSPDPDTTVSQTSRTRRSTVAQGIGVSGLNPKALVMFVSVLPQFTRPGSAWPIREQLGALGILFSLTCAAAYLIIGISARRVLRSRPRTARKISRASGLCMIAISVALVIELVLA